MRERNGHVDNGRALNSRKCPNCGSASFRETLSREHCPSCGLECDYWGGGANEVYEQMMAREYAREQHEQDEIRRKEEEAEREYWLDQGEEYGW